MNINPILPLTKFDQVGVAVRDVDQAVAFMNQSFGIEILTLEMPRAKVGKIDLELIQILEGEHIVKEFLSRNGPGLHHLGIYVDNLQTAVERWKQAGGKVVQETDHPDGIGTVYLDTENELGSYYIELIKL